MKNPKLKLLNAVQFAFSMILVISLNFAMKAQPTNTKLQNRDEIFAAAQKAYKEGQSVNDKSSTQDIRNAISKMQTASSLFKEINKLNWAGVVIIEMGWKYQTLGEWDECLKSYKQAEEIFHKTKNVAGEAVALNSAGWIYRYSGEFEKALANHEKAEILYESINDLEGQAMTISSIGGVYIRNGQDKKALEYLWRSLELRQKLNKEFDQGMNFLDIGMAYRHLGDKEKAIVYLKKDFEIMSRYNSEWGLSNVLDELGGCYRELGKFQEALRYYNLELYYSRKLTNSSHKAIALSNLMYVWNDLRNQYLAILYGKEAVNTFQEFRARAKRLNKEIQKTYLKLIEHTYRKLADLLIAQGRISEAEKVLGMLKEEEFFEYLRRDDKAAKELKAIIKLTPTEEEAFKRYEEIADEITRIGREFGELEKESKKFPVGKFPRQAEMDRLDAQVADARKVFNKFLEELDARFRNKETKEKDARVAQISSTKALLDSLNQPRTVIISTIAGEDRLNLIVTTSKINRAHTVDIKASDLNKLVVEFRDAVKNPQIDPRPLGKKLYDVLFPADLRKDLAGVDADTIVWSLDSTLRYAPMSALWDGEKYLVERYSNAIITLASRDKIDKTPAARTNWTALGLGVSQQFETFPALNAVPEELCRVVNDEQKKADCLKLTGGKTGVFGGINLSDGEFTFENLKLHLGRYPIVHIASHFSLNAGTESDSYLLLGGGKTSQERKLSISAVREKLDTKFVGTELLVLSACNTAMSSGENSSGAEIEGFGALAQEQGAKTVLATLWAVADDSTKELMTEYYQTLETNPAIGKAEAMRQAQLKLMYGKYTPEEARKNRSSEKIILDGSSQPEFKIDKNSLYSHPYFWSPFILFGNWK